MALLRARKAELRQIVQNTLRKLDEAEIARQSSLVCTAITATAEYQAANGIGIYLSMPIGELCTDGIVRHALKAGKKVYVPYLYNKRVEGEKKLVPSMDMALLHSESDYDSLSRDKWGIPSLDYYSLNQRTRCLEGSRHCHGHLDLLLVPGVAFDFTMGRLGHGKGYYDRFIPAYQAEKLRYQPSHEQLANGDMNVPPLKKPCLFGLALEQQMLNLGHLVPVEGSDCRMDAVFVGSGKMIRASSTM